MATRKWGTEAVVNTTTSGNQTNSDVAALSDGGYVVTWEDGSGVDTSIRSQKYDATGHQVGGEQVIASAGGVDYSAPSITALADGGYWIAYVRGVGADNYIEGKVYNAAGTFVRDQLVVFAYGKDRDVHLTAVGTGAVAAWFDPEGQDVLFRTWDAAGTGSGVFTATGTGFAANVEGSPDGATIAVAWTSGGNAWGRLFTPSGAPSSAQFQITSGITAFDPKIAWLGDETFAVVYRAFVPGGGGIFNNEQRVKIFDSNSNYVTDSPAAITLDLQVNGYIEGSQQSAVVTTLPNGGFAVAWVDTSQSGGDDDSFAIHARAFDGAGGRVGTEIVVNTDTAGAQDEPSITALSDGRFVVTWTDSFLTNTDGSGTAIRSQIVDPREGMVTGHGGNDELLGHTAVNDELNGFAGDDTMSGFNGNDVFYGGQGKDVAKGGRGEDTLIGGLGADKLDGGLGDDVFIFEAKLGTDNVDKITDFVSGSDQIGLARDIFRAIGPSLSAAEFYAAAGATKAHDASDRIIYNKTNGKLFYDDDGNMSGGHAPVLFAILTGHPAVALEDIFVV